MHRLTVDVNHGTWTAFNEQIESLNENLPNSEPRVKKTHILRGLIGTWVQDMRNDGGYRGPQP